MNRAFRGLWIPREIWLHSTLSIHEKLMFAEIDSLDDSAEGGPGCTATNAYLGSFFDLGETRVKEILARLVDLGLVSSTLSPGGRGTARVLRSLLTVGLSAPPDESAPAPTPAAPDAPLFRADAPATATAAPTNESIYLAYPRLVKRQTAIQKIDAAVKAIAPRFSGSLRSARVWLLERVTAYAAARQAVHLAHPDEKRFTPHCSTWMHGGRYDDDETEWTSAEERGGDAAVRVRPVRDPSARGEYSERFAVPVETYGSDPAGDARRGDAPPPVGRGLPAARRDADVGDLSYAGVGS